MTFDELNNPAVTEETPAVESETTEPSTSEVVEPQTTTEPEEAPADVLEQPEPVDETPRAQKRIQELTRKNKELEEKAAYWDQLSAKIPDAVDENEDGTVTVDAIADAVLRKQEAKQIENNRTQAQTDMQRDAAETLIAYPVLEKDNELADMVVAYAEKNRISIKAAAAKVMNRFDTAQKKAEAKTLASQATRAGASSPTGERVSTGAMAPPDVSKMSEEEKAANWDNIIASYGS